ncbi:hypothetical protein PBY51_015622 [Eleginops maclovinus]|uniref:Uncharacterized protein n=1 Tax=Eleginops maclovinus TaxID=56733 RepID=A0AAN7XHJ2_ELEMC|nr:hypothetical protein PBY51_015622 [Eleginops maclovinus]
MQKRREAVDGDGEPPCLHNTLLIEKHLGIMMEVRLSGSVVKRKRGLSSRFPRQPAKENIRRTQMSRLARPR